MIVHDRPRGVQSHTRTTLDTELFDAAKPFYDAVEEKERILHEIQVSIRTTEASIVWYSTHLSDSPRHLHEPVHGQLTPNIVQARVLIGPAGFSSSTQHDYLALDNLVIALVVVWTMILSALYWSQRVPRWIRRSSLGPRQAPNARAFCASVIDPSPGLSFQEFVNNVRQVYPELRMYYGEEESRLSLERTLRWVFYLARGTPEALVVNNDDPPQSHIMLLT